MTRLHNIFVGENLYEVTSRGNLIVSIVRYADDNHTRTVVHFDELSPLIQNKILDELPYATQDNS